MLPHRQMFDVIMPASLRMNIEETNSLTLSKKGFQLIFLST